MIYSVCVIAWGTFGPTRSARRSVHARSRMVHYQVWAIDITSVRHGVLLLCLMHIVLAAVVAHDPIVCDSTLRLILHGLASLRDFAGVDDATAHALIEGAGHVQAVLLVVYHAFSVSLAWGAELVLVVPAVAAGSLVQNALILPLIATNLSHEIIILWDHVAPSIASLLPTWLIPLAWRCHCAVLHAKSTVVVGALAALVHALHIFGDDVILASLGGVLVHVT